MSSLSFYPTESDLGRLLRRLNADADVGFLIEIGGRGWMARRTLPALTPGRYILWHLPSGPLRLESGELIENPWQGWQSVRPDGPGLARGGWAELVLESGYGRFDRTEEGSAIEEWWQGLAQALS